MVRARLKLIVRQNITIFINILNSKQFQKSWYHRASFGPKYIVPLSEISLPMPYCFESGNDSNNSPESSLSWLRKITLGQDSFFCLV